MDLVGWVFDESRVAVSGATVDIYAAASPGAPGGAAEASTTTSSNGYWTATGLTAAAKDVKVDKAGTGFWIKGLAEWCLAKLWLSTGLYLVDQGSAPAAPGASATVIYSIGGVLYSRAGASGVSQVVGGDPLVIQLWSRSR